MGRQPRCHQQDSGGGLTRLPTLNELSDRLTRPTTAEIETLARHPGDIIVLGASGKMGPSLIGRLRRADPDRVIYAVSRRPIATSAIAIEADLHNPDEVADLPYAPNVFYLVGRKFGSTGRPEVTWATNTIVPSLIGHHYRDSKIVAFSSGNVYPLVSVNSTGSVESDTPRPLGEYAQSVLARERIFEYYARENSTPTIILRLNYAIDLRYGTLVDIARRVWTGQPLPIRVPQVNAIWQGDANSYAIQSLDLCASPAKILNISGPEIVHVVGAGQWFAQRFNKPLTLERGTPGMQALLNNASLCHQLLGPPEVDLATLQEWVAQWIEQGGELLDKPTHFEATDGNF